MFPSGPWSARRSGLVAAGLYLVVALWSLRVVLLAPATVFPYRAILDGQNWLKIEQSDQRFVAWNVARNARLMLTRPTRLFDADQQCYPTPNALTLGDHMLGEGLLGAVPFSLTRDPIVTYNVVLILTPWIAALAMYALVRHWTGSAPAAFVAGFLFAFHPVRLADPSHPYVPGNHWTPLALLFAHRLFWRRGWGDAAGLALFIGLQLLEGFYQVIGLLLIGGLYGLFLLARHWRAIGALVPKLAVVGAAVAGVTAAVLHPYLRTQATWATLSDRPTFLVLSNTFWPGGAYYPGTVATLLAALALLDRLRGARRTLGHDPRLILALGGFVAYWTVIWGFTVPVTGWYVPPLYPLLAAVLPGLKAVRAIASVGIGVGLVAAFLAGWGVYALIERRGTLFRFGVTAAIVTAAFAEVFNPALATRSWGQPVTLKAYEVRPPADAIAVARQAEPGAVLDLPFHYDLIGLMRSMAYYIFWGAFHQRPMAACFNSFTPPIREEIETLANRLPDPRAADALYALGFRTVVLHHEFLLTGEHDPYEAKLSTLVDGGRLAEFGRAAGHVFWRLKSPTPIVPGFAALAARDGSEGEPDRIASEATVGFAFRNATAAVYRHPDPIEPTALLVRWFSASGELVLERPARALLPLALAPGEETVRALRVPLPPAPGDYEATLAPATEPALVLARRRVTVTSGAATP